MATHPKDKKSQNPRIQCSVCGQWKRLHCKPYQSAGGYEATQTFFGGCAYTDGDHFAGDHIDVCDGCCHIKCKAIAEKRPPKTYDDEMAQAKYRLPGIMFWRT